MKTRIFDHIDLRVAEMAPARKFYGQLLPALGFSEASGNDDVRTYQAPGDKPTAFFAFEIDRKQARIERLEHELEESEDRIRHLSKTADT